MASTQDIVAAHAIDARDRQEDRERAAGCEHLRQSPGEERSLCEIRVVAPDTRWRWRDRRINSRQRLEKHAAHLRLRAEVAHDETRARDRRLAQRQIEG